MGIQIKILKVEGLPLGHTVYFTLKFKDDNDDKSVIPPEARTNRSVVVNIDYPQPEWKNEAYYFKPAGSASKKQDFNYPSEESFIESASPKIYFWSAGSVFDSRLASGRISLKSAIPGKPVREVFHLEGEAGHIPAGRSVAVTVELLADLADDAAAGAAGSSLLLLGRAPPVLQPPSASNSPSKQTPQKKLEAADASPPQSKAGTSAPPSPARNLLLVQAGGGGGGGGAGRSNGVAPDLDDSVDELLEGLQRTFPILEQRLHIVTRSLDRRDRQLLDLRSRLIAKTNSVNLLTEEVNGGSNRNNELSDRIAELEADLADKAKKASQASALHDQNAALVKDRDSIVTALNKELANQRETAEDATRVRISLDAELSRLKKKIQQREQDDRSGGSGAGSNAELFAEKTIAEARVHGLTAELAECRDQLSRARARETSLIENVAHLTTRSERLGSDLDRKTGELAELHRQTEKSCEQRHAKINEILARQDGEVKQARDEKEAVVRDLDRLRVQLQEADVRGRDSEARASETKRRQRDLVTELEELKGELLRAKETARVDIAEHQNELSKARESELAARRLESQATIEAKNLRLQLQEADRQRQKLSNAVAELSVRIDAALLRNTDLESEVKKERRATESAVQQSRDIMEASAAESLRKTEMLKIAHELASSLADQLRNERLQKEAAESDKAQTKASAEEEKKKLDAQREKEKAALIAKETERVLGFQLQSLLALERTARDSLVSGSLDLGSGVVGSLIEYAFAGFANDEMDLAKLREESSHLAQAVESLTKDKQEVDEQLRAEKARNEEEIAAILQRHAEERQAAVKVTCEIGCDPIEELLAIAALASAAAASAAATVASLQTSVKNNEPIHDHDQSAETEDDGQAAQRSLQQDEKGRETEERRRPAPPPPPSATEGVEGNTQTQQQQQPEPDAEKTNEESAKHVDPAATSLPSEEDSSDTNDNKKKKQNRTKK